MMRARAGDDDKSESRSWRSVDSESKSNDWRERERESKSIGEH
jgi:hypothetical protein